MSQNVLSLKMAYIAHAIGLHLARSGGDICSLMQLWSKRTAKGAAVQYDNRRLFHTSLICLVISWSKVKRTSNYAERQETCCGLQLGAISKDAAYDRSSEYMV